MMDATMQRTETRWTSIGIAGLTATGTIFMFAWAYPTFPNLPWRRAGLIEFSDLPGGLAGELFEHGMIRLCTQCILALVILAVGAARVYQGVPWFSNVIGG